MSETPKRPPSPVDPGGAEPPTPPATPQPETEEPGGMISEGGAPAPDDGEREGGMIGEG